MSGAIFMASLLNGADVEWKELGDVIRLDGLYPAYNGGLSHSGFTDTFNYSENKTIVSQGGASAGFVNFVTSKFYANAHCYVVLPNTGEVVNRYVYHLVKMNQERLTGKQHGAGIPALRTGEILEIPLPRQPQEVARNPGRNRSHS
jgi:type I restriction enzyme S subunit